MSSDPSAGYGNQWPMKLRYDPPVPHEWHMPQQVMSKISGIKAGVDILPMISGCEVAMVPIVEPVSATLLDVRLIPQLVSPGGVFYPDGAIDQVSDSVLGMMYQGLPVHALGIFHYHPFGYNRPSEGMHGDLWDFEKITRYNSHCVHSYGWVDRTSSFALAQEGSAFSLLRENEGVIVGAGKAIMQLTVGYSLFAIFSNKDPWVGVGIHSREGFNGPEWYSLHGPDKGARLILEDIRVPADIFETEFDIAGYVKPMIPYVQSARPQVTEIAASIAKTPDAGLRDVSSMLPMTLEEALHELERYKEYAGENGALAGPIATILELLRPIVELKGYDLQLQALQAALGILSQAYSERIQGEKP